MAIVVTECEKFFKYVSKILGKSLLEIVVVQSTIFFKKIF